MKVDFVNQGRLYGLLKDELDSAYFDVISKGEFNNGKHVKLFENELANFTGAQFAVGFNNGLSALIVSLQFAGIGSGDEVIVPAFAFASTYSAIANLGATPVLVDVKNDFNIDVSKIEEVITKNTKAIILVHYFGWMADMQSVTNLAKKYNLFVIEDARQSLGSSINTLSAGTWGQSGCFSFEPLNIMGGIGNSGAIVTNDKNLATFAKNMQFCDDENQNGESRFHKSVYCLDNLQAAFLRVKLKHLPAAITRRKLIADTYYEELFNIEELLLPTYTVDGFDHIYNYYSVLSKQGSLFSDFLISNGVEVHVKTRKPYFKNGLFGISDRSFPVTEKMHNEICSLPLSYEITDNEVDYVISVVKKFYKK